MRRLIVGALLLFLGLGLAARGQQPVIHLLLLAQKKAVAPAGYAGPGNVVSGAYAYWGFRCYNTAYTGNVADIWDSATGNTTETLLTCSAGGTINQTINTLATTCATACSVKTMYDQSGNTNCTTACDATQTTNANRPALTVSAFNGKPCALFTRANSHQLSSTNSTLSQSQPLTWVGQVERNGSFTSFNTYLGTAGIALFFENFANTASIYSGITIDYTAADSALHSLISIGNGASSNVIVDGSAGANMNAGTNGIVSGNSLLIGNDGSGNFLQGYFCEGGVWPIAFNSTQYGNMATNQAAYW